MKINKKQLKKQVIEDWQNAFPQLVKYSQNKLYKILGPIITGIELIKLPYVDEYRPHFVIYSLWGNKIGKDLKSCLSGPIVLKEFYDKKGFQFSIPYQNHNDDFLEVLNAVKEQLPFSLEGNVYSNDIFSSIQEYYKIALTRGNPNSYQQALDFEFLLEFTLCAKMNKKALDVLSQIRKKNWDKNQFTTFNIDCEEWLKKIEDKVENKEKLLLQLETNKQNKKLEKLIRSDLI